MVQIKLPLKFQLPAVVLIALILVSGFILGLSSGGFIVDFKQAGFSFFTSIQKGTHSTTTAVSDLFTSIGALRVLRHEYDTLSKKMQDYEQLKINHSELFAENERLSELLNISQSYSKKNIPAYIIGRDASNIYSALTINKGSKHGIKKNMHVIAYQNDTIGLVGKIIEVGQNTSLIMPIYDYQYNVSARIQKTRDLGMVSGLGIEDGTVTLRYIKKRVLGELAKGDLVSTSGENENYERDIPIGTIAKITVRDYDSSLEIDLDPIISFSRLDTVIVVDMQQPKD